MKGLWFSELQTPSIGISCLTKATLHSEKTEYQDLMVIDTVAFGRMLLLDGVIQTTIKDEFVYHEMIAHVALNTLKNPKRALVVGGGDGGSIREIIKHPSIEKATLVEIDRRVVEVSKEYLPEISVGLQNPKVEIIYDDGIKHVKEHKNTYDLIIVDSTDPVGPAVGLFAKEFYASVFEALTDEGIFVAQTESPFFEDQLIRRVYKDVKDIFPVAKLMLANIPTYPGGLWTFTMGSKKYDPEQADLSNIPPLNTKYYSPEVHKAAFVLPPFVQDIIKY
ncbi:MAG: polyamine aminopropyltransferase [Clostridia bacterium]|jgi:spermidine synthase|nr:polyamine aminopropyltransferase [Clostridia bacterium]